MATYSALKTLLTRRGWNVQIATSVRDGRMLLAHMPKVVVLDLMLPDGDGGVLLEEIRRKNLPVKVAVQTGVNDANWLDRIKALQPELVLRKPIDLAQLVNFLAKYQE